MLVLGLAKEAGAAVGSIVGMIDELLHVGRIELQVLLVEGLHPDLRLVDLLLPNAGVAYEVLLRVHHRRPQDLVGNYFV
eukprot:CAMPEP_0170511152 /NCGR_PEP_ID=MMETSP0208-20121228/66147_1 /TAXON_ID=197538 /ORGANISM="Strombidium inclinatum, Strain S3" /LENGTH=78 /DNA_ID=CAMNT_0010794661 /DNA_START=876 /DNA_END=1112 /DNA_ORIENTATION=-